MKVCTHCGQWFAPKFAKVKLCFDCFKKREKALEAYDGLNDEIMWLRRLLREAESAKQQAEIKAFEAHERAFDTHYRAGNQPAPFTIPPDKLKTLIQLAHPDKHNGSQAANDVTAWLLSLRKERAV